MATRNTVLVREIAWFGCIVAGLALIASATFAGSWLLRFEWFSRLFRIPNESVLIPFWLAVFVTPLVAAGALVFWLGRLLVPTVEASRPRFLFAHLAALALVLGVGCVMRPAAWSVLLALGLISAAVLVTPRLLFRPLSPRGR